MASAEFDVAFDVDTNAKTLVGLLTKSLDEAKNCDTGVKLRSGKNYNEINPTLHLTHEQFLKIMTTQLKDVVEMVGTVRTELYGQINELKQENASLRRELINTKCDLEMQQQYGNRDTLKLCNIPEPTLGHREKEDTNDTIVKVLGEAGITITKEDISVSHRLPNEKGIKPLICKFGRRDVRNNVIRCKRQMRESTTFKDSNPDGFMVEHLTPLRGKVAYLLCKDSNIAKSWSIDGRLKVFKTGYTESDKPINITSLNDLTKLGWSQDRIDNLILRK